MLHDRRAPVGYGQVDHLVVNDAGVHLVETVPVSTRAPLWVDAEVTPRVGGLPLRQRLEHVVDLAGELADRVNLALGRPRALLGSS